MNRLATRVPPGEGGSTREGGRQEGTGEERREEIIDASERGAARTRRPFIFLLFLSLRLQQ